MPGNSVEQARHGIGNFRIRLLPIAMGNKLKKYLTRFME